MPAEQAVVAVKTIDSAIYGQDAKKTFSALAQASAEKKYELLTLAAQESTGKTWSCPAFERLYSIK